MKGLEALKRITLKDFILNDDSSLNDIKIIGKELKALEIIINTGILTIHETIGGNHYIEIMCDTIGITKGEYDLLKEVLL